LRRRRILITIIIINAAGGAGLGMGGCRGIGWAFGRTRRFMFKQGNVRVTLDKSQSFLL
jgi:hypothetical protein